MRKMICAFAMAAMSTAASAQTATTNCMAMESMVNCNTVGGGDDHSLEILANVIHNASESSIRSKLGRMVAEGHCQEARDYALKKGRLELASSVERLCSTQTASSPAATAYMPAPPKIPQQTQPVAVSQDQSQSANAGWPGLTPYQEGRLLAAIQIQKEREANPNE